MNNIHRTFLSILKASLLGERAELDNFISYAEWQQLFMWAEIHRVLPLVYEAVYDSAALKEALEREQCNSLMALLSLVKQKVRRQVMLQTVRTSEFLALNRALQAAGVRPLVVKGLVCRDLYPKPDARQSSDEDVLIPAEQFETCHRVMEEFGMKAEAVDEALTEAFEVPYRKEGSPLYIELHKQLFPPGSEAYGDLNGFFEGVFDRCVVEEIQGETVFTLGYTDHLFYLICHAFKHFLHSGFGVRQVCDIVMYANRYGSRIDWELVLEHCKAINAGLFAAALFQIGRKYLGFDPEQAAYPDVWREIVVDEQAMLEDLLEGGLYGDADMSRRHSSNITLDAVASGKAGRKAGNKVVLSLFPTAKALAGRYPYLQKHPYLLPVAWCERLFQYSRRNRNGLSEEAVKALKIGDRRVELLRQYGIIE